MRVRRSLILAAGVLQVAALSLVTATTANSGEVATASAQRERLGFSTEPALVESLLQSPSSDDAWGVPLTADEAEEMDRRSRIPILIEDLRNYVEGHPRRFGQLWIDQAAGGQLVIEVTAAADESDRAATRSLLPDGMPMRFETVVHAMVDLAAVQADLSAGLAEGQESHRGIAGIGVPRGSNRLEVTVIPQRRDAIERLIEERGLKSMVRIVEGEYDRSTACNDRLDCWQSPMRGGLRVNPDFCSTGYVVYDLTSTNERLMTAGHCLKGDMGDMRWHDVASHHLGEGLLHSYTNNSFGDFGLLKMNEIQSWADHVVYRTNDDKAHPMHAYSDAAPGLWVCMLGATSGRRCGDIDLGSYTSYGDDGVTLLYQVTAKYTPQGGDSGAPVINGDYYVGLQSRKRGNGDGVFSDMAFFNAVTGFEDYKVCVVGGSSEC